MYVRNPDGLVVYVNKITGQIIDEIVIQRANK
jgi:hypothetical protein